MNEQGCASLRAIRRVSAVFFLALFSFGCSGPADKIHADIVKELAAAYASLGKPPASFETMQQVQKTASAPIFKKFKEEWPDDATFSLSALPDGIAIYIKVGGKEKRERWRP